MTTRSADVLRPLPLSSAPVLNAPIKARALWLDAFRGFTMLCLVSRGFGIPRLKELPQFQYAADNIFEHAAWVGITPWDLIQPFFMFIVGAAMPLAFAARRARGGSWIGGWPHVLWRAFMLLLLSHIAMIGTGGTWGWQLINVLAQIALAYVITYLVLDVNWKAQLGFALALLATHWVMHVTWSGVWGPGAWVKDANVGSAIDMALLGRTTPGGYATLNFLTSATALIGGIMATNVLRSPMGTGRKFALVAGAAVVLIGLGCAISPWVPVIKRIWTPSFAMISVGITLLALLVFFAIDLAWPKIPWGILLAIGANCIFIYMTNILFGGKLREIVGRLLGPMPGWAADRFDFPVEPWRTFAIDWIALAILVGVAWWLYRRKILIKI